ncbi:MAG: hypothetical protein Q9222_005513 [Ikaeria aurantiellina]
MIWSSVAVFSLCTAVIFQTNAFPTSSDSDDDDQHMGDKQSDDAVCSSYAECGSKGLQYWNTLHTTLSMANPVDRTDGPEKFQEFYAVTASETPWGMSRIQQDVISHGFDPKLLTGWDTVSKHPDTGQLDSQNPAYQNDFDTRNGLLVASANFREWDSQRQLPWSELMFQTWQVVQHAQQGGSISNLRAVVRKEVEGQGAQEVLKTLYTSRGLTMNQGDGTWYQWSEEVQPYFFYALLATDNVKGVVWLLNDHPNALGKKEITDIWTRWEKRDPDMWINIGPAEWLKYLDPVQ